MAQNFKLFDTHIVVGDTSLVQLKVIISNLKPSSVFIFLDANTKKYCLPSLLKYNPQLIDSHIIELPIGESLKSLAFIHDISVQLINLHIDRNSIIINLGGGVICDFGGFLSSVIKRGVKFINIPTTLMAQVDASIGGKVALNINSIKNQIGLFNNPEAVIVYPPYVVSLSNDDFLSAVSEVFKYGIIYDETFWHSLQKSSFHKNMDLNSIIFKCIKIKIDIVNLDFFDMQERRMLNFGHSIGHALESYFSHHKNTISHGYALAAGIICEAYISKLKYNFPAKKLDCIIKKLSTTFPLININELDNLLFLDHLKFDKKNRLGVYNFTLIKDIAKPIFNSQVLDHEILEALDFYRQNVTYNFK